MSITYYILLITLFFVGLIAIVVIFTIIAVLPQKEKKDTKFFKLITNTWRKLEENNVYLSKLLLLLAVIVFILLTFLSNDSFQSFLNGISVEMFGIVFDVAVLVLLSNWISGKGEKKKRIQRYNQELNDYRGWTENEAAYRIAGIIGRLKSEGEEDINYCNLHLGKCSKETIKEAIKTNIKIASLENANLKEVNFEGLIFKNINMKGVDLYGANLQGADLENVNLQSANLHGINLQNAIIRDNINLTNALMWGADFKGMKLRNISDGLSWIDNLSKWEVDGDYDIQNTYYVEDEEDKTLLGLLGEEEILGNEKHIIREIEKGKLRGTEVMIGYV